MSLVSFMSEPMSAEQSSLMFNPLANIVRSIIANANGAMLDPSDMTTMFQDAAGTTPVTAVEQPVGLMMDKSQGLMLGPELVSNGDFSNGLTGWSVVTAGASTVTAYNGGARIISVAADIAGITFPYNNTKRRYLLVEFDVISISGTGYVHAGDGSASQPARYDFSSAGHKRVVLYASTVAPLLAFIRASTCDFVIDNISVRELKGNHATQSITASRPVLSARKNILMATETLATQSVTALAAQYTLSFTGTGSVTLSGTATGTLTGTGVNDRVSLTVTPTAGTLTLTVSGSVTKAQLELGASAGPYQRVNTATDYDTDERYFPKYLSFDGVDDYLNLPYMGLYAGGSASVVAGLSQFGPDDVYERIVGETSSVNSTPRYIMLRGALNGAGCDTSIVNDYGTALLDGSDLSSTIATPTVISATDTGSLYKIYRNSSTSVSDSYSRVGQTITLTNTTLGAQIIAGGTYNGFAKMKLYGLLITKSALSDAQRIQCERLLARKAGVQL